jgi:hypothetical protein
VLGPTAPPKPSSTTSAKGTSTAGGDGLAA